jgi:predicted Fe-Mo cluster-binding NifX family protein
MKIAVSASSPALESPVDPRFGRCLYFLIVDPKTMEFDAVENPYTGASGGAGIQAAQLVIQKKVEAVLTGSCGPNAYQTLQTAGVKVVLGVAGTAAGAVQKYASGGEFRGASGPDVPPHFGMGRGAGAGGGRGRGMAMSQGRGFPGSFAQPGSSVRTPEPSPRSPEDELEELKKQARELQRHMDSVAGRIAALKKKRK